MSKHNGTLVRSAREHVFALFRRGEHLGLEYHQFTRTRDVVEACKEIATGSEIDDEAREIVLLCAWFFDACYATDSDDHARSLELCTRFLEEQHAKRPTPEDVAACYRAVDAGEGAPSDPSGAIPAGREAPADVLHDANLAVLASDDYVQQAELLRLELQRTSGKTYSDVDWTQECIAYFAAHPFRTRFAQLRYGAGRAANLARLQKLLRRQRRQLERAHKDEVGAANRVGRSAETLFYHFTRIQIGLVGLADRRTNTMIHVNSIMMSIVVALLGRRIHTEHDLMIPTVLLLCVNATVLFLAIHSMRVGRRHPGLTSALTPDEARVEDANLLAITNESPLSLSEWTERMHVLFADPMQFQRNVIEHLYFGRRVIVERGKALRLTYQVFMYGITAAALAFAVALATR